MSLILDALRKMEQDRKSRRGPAVDIRPEVLRYRAASKPQQSRSLLPVALGALLLACVIGAGLFLKGKPETVVVRDAAPVAVLAPAAGGTTDQPLVQALPTAAGAAGTPVPLENQAIPGIQGTQGTPVTRTGTGTGAGTPAAGALGVVPSTVPAGTVAGDTRPARQPAAPPRERLEPVRSALHKPAPREAAALPQAAPADIVITGIAWQDERSLRRAVVNGALVGEGAEVAGARVVEIREDRVRLTRGGQLFDAVFSAGFSR